MKQLSVKEVHDLLNENNNVVLIDVRETWETEICKVDVSVHIPMADIPDHLEQLDKETIFAVMCHHGMRSLQVCEYMQSQGFTNLCNVSGGIDAWAREIDTSLELY